MQIDLCLSSPVLQDDQAFAQVARALLEVTIWLNRLHLRRVGAPPIYGSGVRYRLEPAGREIIADIPEILGQRWADCAMLSAWRVAELREAGEDAGINIKWQRLPDGRRLFHARVRRGDGRIEDPSIRLGMWSGEGKSVDELPVKA